MIFYSGRSVDVWELCFDFDFSVGNMVLVYNVLFIICVIVVVVWLSIVCLILCICILNVLNVLVSCRDESFKLILSDLFENILLM